MESDALDIKKFDTLYKKASGGAIQEWTIFTEDNVIVTRYGQLGGAIQQARDVIKEGKNPGKKNATTATEQAQKEAEAKWTKQLKKGYVKTIELADQGKVDEIIEGGVAPMLAKRFDEYGHKIEYPAFLQPKFDGHRCIVVFKDGKATMWSRTRKPITGLPHIIRAVEDLCRLDRSTEVTFDGELYNHDYRDRFEELSSFIRNPEPKPGHEVVQYHIYDLTEEGRTQDERFEGLSTFFNGHKQLGPLVAVETITVADEDEAQDGFERFLKQGYEGAMLRNTDGLYEPGKRSVNLQKMKEFSDAEFKVVGVEEGRGKLAGKAIFVLETENKTYPNGEKSIVGVPGKRFRAKMKGKIEDLKKYVDDPSLAVGRMLTVKYFGFTNKEQVPRFPVGERFFEEL
jgi:ATP-dependent DNA ligase